MKSLLTLLTLTALTVLSAPGQCEEQLQLRCSEIVKCQYLDAAFGGCNWIVAQWTGEKAITAGENRGHLTITKHYLSGETGPKKILPSVTIAKRNGKNLQMMTKAKWGDLGMILLFSMPARARNKELELPLTQIGSNGSKVTSDWSCMLLD